MKITLIALSAALVAAAPAVSVQAASRKAPGHEMQHKHAKKHHPAVSGYALWREPQARGYPGAFGYAPFDPNVPHRDMTDISSQAGGGGGGGGGM